MQNAKLLRSSIEERGLKLKFVAEKTGIPYNTLSQYVGGFRAIPESKLRCICLTLGIDLKKFGLSEGNISQPKAV